MDFCEFEASLVYIEYSILTRTTYRDSGKKQNKTKQERPTLEKLCYKTNINYRTGFHGFESSQEVIPESITVVSMVNG